MNRFLFAAAVFAVLSGGGLCCKADTYTLPCGTMPSTNPADGTCTGPSPYKLVMVDAVAGPVSSSWVGTATVEFTGGPVGETSGYFVPCLHTYVVYGGGGTAAANAQFGSVGINFNAGTCSGSANDFTPSDVIPFSFGTTQTFGLSLSVSGFGGASGGGLASSEFDGFEVFDTSGNLIPATVTFAVGTPEPGLLWPISALVGCAVVVWKRRLV